MRWPAAWRDPTHLDLLRESPVNCLLFESPEGMAAVLETAQKKNIKTVIGDPAPAEVEVLRGEWPGVKLSQTGAQDRASSGPTGAPWIDSNGWAVRLALALNPHKTIWVGASPQKPGLPAESYVVALADAAVHGGRWIIALDSELAAGIIGQKPDPQATWKKIASTAAFFDARKSWSGYVAEAVLGIVSDFAGRNEFMSHELLNLTARTNQQYRIIPKSRPSPRSFAGLKAVLYTDDEPPDSGMRDLILEFVNVGGTLVTGPKWGAIQQARMAEHQHPRYTIYTLGKGRVAVAQPDFEDPFIVANDAVILMSHRYELLRFWNVGAMGSYFTMEPGSKHGVVQLLFYSTARFGNSTARIPYHCRKARLWTLDRSDSKAVEMENDADGTEFHLPPISSYGAIELEL